MGLRGACRASWGVALGRSRLELGRDELTIVDLKRRVIPAVAIQGVQVEGGKLLRPRRVLIHDGQQWVTPQATLSGWLWERRWVDRQADVIGQWWLANRGPLWRPQLLVGMPPNPKSDPYAAPPW